MAVLSFYMILERRGDRIARNDDKDLTGISR